MRFRTAKRLLLIAITLLAAFLRLYKIDSLPPSDGYDQATYGLDVLDILDGARPIFLPSNFGREALFSYLVTLCYLLIHDAAVAVYVTSAVVGVLAVPAVYLAGEELFSSEQDPLARYGGLIAALAMAVSYWHLSWSRLGMRVILVPFFAAMTAGLLWRGFRTGSRWAFAGCGFFLGLSMHSYQAARALPLLVLLGFVYVFGSRRTFSRGDLVNVILVFAIAALVFAPLGFYFANHAGSSGLRIGQTLVVRTSQSPGDNVRTLIERFVHVALALGWSGDTDARVNIPGRPALSPFLLAAALVGLAISLARIRRPAYLFTVTWLAGLTAPAVLAELGATTKRALGATPAIAMLIAVGCLVSWDRIRGWAARRSPSWGKGTSLVLAGAIGLGFVYSGVRTYRDYFVVWRSDPNLFTHFETGQSAIGRYIKELPLEERIYISPVPADHHSVVLNSGRREGTKGYQGRFCMVVPERTVQGTTYIIVPMDDERSLPLLQAYLPQGEIADEGPLHYQLPYFLAYRIPVGAEAQVAPSHVQRANWDNRVELLGYDLDKPAYTPGDSIRLTLYLKALSSMDADYTVFTHLLGPTNPATNGPLWSQSDSEPCKRGYPTSVWDEGEIVIDQFVLAVPGTAPAHTYELEIGFYDWQTMIRLPTVAADGTVLGDHVLLGKLPIE